LANASDKTFCKDKFSEDLSRFFNSLLSIRKPER